MSRALAFLALAACGGAAASTPVRDPAVPVVLTVRLGQDIDGVVPHEVLFAVRNAVTGTFASAHGYRLVSEGRGAYAVTVDVVRYRFTNGRADCSLAAVLQGPQGQPLNTVSKSRARAGGDDRPLDCARDLAHEAAEVIVRDLEERR